METFFIYKVSFEYFFLNLKGERKITIEWQKVEQNYFDFCFYTETQS
jgi:hypothetical protein